jgi:hypothetical protein
MLVLLVIFVSYTMLSSLYIEQAILSIFLERLLVFFGGKNNIAFIYEDY